MKFLKTIAIAIFLFLALNAVKAQEAWVVDESKGGYYYSLSWVAWDSADLAGNLYSKWSSDLTTMDAQTIYYTYNYSQGTDEGSAADDSIKVIIEGRINSNLWLDVDSINIIGSNDGRVQGSFTFHNFFPEYRIRIEEITAGATTNSNKDEGTLYLGFYAKTSDAIYEKKNFVNPWGRP